MYNLNRLTVTIVVAALTLALPLAAQTREGVMGELLKDTAEVEKKVLALANAMPESMYAWRPAPGVRSAGEVFQHVASDNYFLPALLDIPVPKETGITKEFKTAVAFEKRPMNKAAVIGELERSFAFLRTSMNGTTDAQLDSAIDLFGRKSTTRGLWITTATHLHEHLGQLIAYARSNQLVPPWSK
jgi:hypothetical protein